jgi:hypothetical protein
VQTISWQTNRFLAFPSGQFKERNRFCRVVCSGAAQKAGGLQFLCCQGIKKAETNLVLDVMVLKPSDTCNAGQYSTDSASFGTFYFLLIEPPEVLTISKTYCKIG